MYYLLGGVVALLLAVHLFRTFWARRSLPQVEYGEFDGELYRVGQTYIARRPARGEPGKTIVCFPGFLEDMRYFQALYAEAQCELILVNNAGYHCAFPTDNAQPLGFPANPFTLGTIEYDGFYLGHIIEALAQGVEVILHGHSRGGAVVLEAGRQYPELMRGGSRRIRAILEAPVLPQARTVGNGSDPLPHRLICYFMPLALGLSRKSAGAQLRKQPMMRPTNALKDSVCASIYTNPSRYSICVANVKSIRQWQLQCSYELYANFDKVTVVMGERDDVLDNGSMLASAQAGAALPAAVDVLATRNTNHFVTLEAPTYLQELAGLGRV